MRRGDWLAADAPRFTLVVDELHLYRGTQGTEVAMIVRNLLGRLGPRARLAAAPCIATSASLTDDDRRLDYLEQFFGVDRSSFFVTAGRRGRSSRRPDLARVRSTRGQARSPSEATVSPSVRSPAGSRRACRDDGGRARATQLPTYRRAAVR